MKKEKPNPLNFFEIRKVKAPIDHFEYVVVPMRYNLEDAVSKWIEHNLRGRFYIGRTLSVNNLNKSEPYIKIGFEEPKELSYFNLACPHLKYV